jgi:branched-chain amino acid transport system substrate-binding protein
MSLSRLGKAFLLFLVLAVVNGMAHDGFASDADQRFTLGCVLPLSGKQAVLGNRMLDSITLALRIFESDFSSPFRLLIEDGKGDPKTSGAAVARLSAMPDIVIIIGPPDAASAVEAAREGQRQKVPVLFSGQTDDIAGTGDYVLNMVATDRMQARTLARYAVSRLGLRRFAVLHPRTKHGGELTKSFREEVQRLGGKIRRVESYDTDQTDFGREIRALGGSKPEKTSAGKKAPFQTSRKRVDFEAIFIPDTASHVRMIIPQLAFGDIKGIPLLGCSGWNSPDLLKSDPDYFEGAVFTSSFFSDSDDLSVRHFVDTFYSVFGREPDDPEAMAYDAAKIAMKAVIEGEGKSRSAVKDRLHRLKDYKGVTGNLSFLESGEMEIIPAVLLVKDHRIMEIEW